MTTRTFLAFDYGKRRIGVATGQAITGTASALTTLHNRGESPDWDAIATLIATWKPDALVIGVPYHMDGTEHAMTAAARRFGRQLHGRFGLAVHEVDERLSSREAETRIKAERTAGQRRATRKGDVDQEAARLLLEAWLQEQEHEGD